MLHKETFISNGYIIVPVEPITLDINCETILKFETVLKPSLIQGNNCKIYNELDILYLKNTRRSLTTEQFNVTYDINHPGQDLDKLRNQPIQLPKLIDNKKLQQARLSLDDTENMLQTIAQHRRTKTLTETALTYLSYLGYVALTLGTLYLMYRIGLFKLVISCIPKKICLFCVKTKVETPTHVVTYNSSVQPLMSDVPKNKRIRI